MGPWVKNMQYYLLYVKWLINQGGPADIFAIADLQGSKLEMTSCCGLGQILEDKFEQARYTKRIELWPVMMSHVYILNSAHFKHYKVYYRKLLLICAW